MKLKLLNLNIYGGKYYNNIISFVKENDFDILCFQEVNGGDLGFTQSDIFQNLKKDLQMDAEIIVSTNLTGDKNSYDGNAIFYKKSLIASNKKNVFIYPFSETKRNETEFRFRPRTAISLNFRINDKIFTVINTQLAWSLKAETTPIKEAVGHNLFTFVKQITNDFILAGDFNLEADKFVVSQFNTLAKNLTEKNEIKNTLNPRTHRAASRIFPKGLAVDHIFTTAGIKIGEFKLIDGLDLSDHFGLSLTFEV
jgi:endonuclease/exonuclease/phosphatase family metal-dependent hydrolase